MKYLAIIMVAGMFASCSSEAPVQEEVVEEVKMEVYGPATVDQDQAISVADLLSSQDGKTVAEEYTFEGEIKEVCSKAGCWVTVDKGDGETFMVRFKDHFTIPTDTKPGTKAIFHGEALNDVIPVDMLKHFAEDGGATEEEIAEITEDKFDLNFTADGVQILSLIHI